MVLTPQDCSLPAQQSGGGTQTNPRSDRGAAGRDGAAFLGKTPHIPRGGRDETLPVSPRCLGVTSHGGLG